MKLDEMMIHMMNMEDIDMMIHMMNMEDIDMDIIK
jgi:hypothetical protein